MEHLSNRTRLAIVANAMNEIFYVGDPGKRTFSSDEIAEIAKISAENLLANMTLMAAFEQWRISGRADIVHRPGGFDLTVIRPDFPELS